MIPSNICPPLVSKDFDHIHLHCHCVIRMMASLRLASGCRLLGNQAVRTPMAQADLGVAGS